MLIHFSKEIHVVTLIFGKMGEKGIHLILEKLFKEELY